MKKRFLIYAALLALLPFFLVASSYVKKKSAWERVQSHIQKVQLLHDSKQKRQSINCLVRQEFGKSDPLLLGELCSQTFLNKEKEALKRLFASRSFTGNEAAEKRYAFITASENQFDFVEGNTQDAEGVLECELSLLHPVEIDTSDIKKLLNQIEERSSGPHLFFTDWKLTRKETGLGSEVYELNLKMLKREYHS